MTGRAWSQCHQWLSLGLHGHVSVVCERSGSPRADAFNWLVENSLEIRRLARSSPEAQMTTAKIASFSWPSCPANKFGASGRQKQYQTRLTSANFRSSSPTSLAFSNPEQDNCLG